MKVFRLCRAPYSALDGEGARRYGGRWNSTGRSVVYASATISLAALEYLVHLDAADAPSDLVAVTIEIPELIALDRVLVPDLPFGWNEYLDVNACRQIGDAWLTAAAVPILAVPAAPVPSEWNYLINPSHPQATNIRIVNEQPFHFDPRLLG